MEYKPSAKAYWLKDKKMGNESSNPNPANSNQEWADLKTYTKAKQVVARQLRAVWNFFHATKSEQGESECRELMAKLAEDRFVLAVVGQFKRGKSSLMNAVIGRELLPLACCRSLQPLRS